MPGQPAERVRIIDAAYRCLADARGARVSISEILTASGLSTRAFYRHFESKDALLLALFRRDGTLVMSELKELAATAGSPAEALSALISGMLGITADDRRARILALGSDEAARARGYAGERGRVTAEQETIIAEILAAGRADGSFPWADPGPDARFIRAALGQAFDDQMAGTARGGAAETAAQLTRFTLRALGARPG